MVLAIVKLVSVLAIMSALAKLNTLGVTFDIVTLSPTLNNWFAVNVTLVPSAVAPVISALILLIKFLSLYKLSKLTSENKFETCAPASYSTNILDTFAFSNS